MKRRIHRVPAKCLVPGEFTLEHLQIHQRFTKSMIETTSATEKYRKRCEDCVHVIHHDERTIIVVADGAGGVGGGEQAANMVVDEVQSHYKSVHSANEWAQFLAQLDQRIGVGESTAVVVDVREFGIAGASIGDSQAWIVDDGQINDLTAHQIRKPLLGSGLAEPIGFTTAPLHGVLIVATDGFFNYAKRDAIVAILAQSDFYSISRKCIELVRLPSGGLWDDIGIVVARNRPHRQTRQRYQI